MKKYFAYLLLAAAFLTSCDPSVDDKSIGGLVSKSDLKVAVSYLPQPNGNYVIFTNSTPGTMSFWDYGLGVSNRLNDTVFVPFKGTYTVNFTAYSGGGSVSADPITFTVNQNDYSEFNKNPKWSALTNNESGKKWVLNMVRPIGWYGTDYGKGSGDDWAWQPSLAEISWAGINASLDYGSITFDLNGGFNVTSTRLDANKQTVTAKGTFNADWTNKFIYLNGCDVPGIINYYPVCTNWRKLRILEFSSTQIVLGVLRDNSSEGVCYIGFTFVPKAAN